MSGHESDGQRPSKRQRLHAGATGTVSNEFGQNTPKQLEFDNWQSPVADPRESQVGIAGYVSDDVIPFNAVFKKRYTDFLVNEVLPGGEVVHLTDMSVPQTLHPSGPRTNKHGNRGGHGSKAPNVVAAEKDSSPTPNGTEKALEKSTDDQSQALGPGEILDADRSQLVTYLGENAVVQLLQLYKTIVENPTRKPKDQGMVRTEFTNDRSLRADIHAALRRVFSSKIESNTDRDGFLCLTASNRSSRKPQNANGDDRQMHYPGKLGWLERGGEYLHFTLCKENKDTMEAVSFLVRQMKVSAKVFQFAGTKDRRAVTSQRVSAYRVDAERLAKQNHHLRNAAVGNFQYQPSSLELGDLGGNEFVVTLRDCEFQGLSDLSPDEKLTKIQSALQLALANLHSNGFINYYGLQRFGTFTTGTDTVGLHILKSDFRAACEAILHFDPEILAIAEAEPESEASTPNVDSKVHTGPGRDEIMRAKAIHLFQKSGNSHRPLEMLPRKFSAENQLIRHLARSPTDYIGGLLAIPRNLRLMYVHAYQSLVWNKAATTRWRLFGNAVAEGDLVLVKEHKDKEATAPGPDEIGPNADIDADGEIIIAPSSHDRSNTVDDIFDRARALTADEAAGGQYSLSDLVLPLPGYDVLYPANTSGAFYKEFMGSKEGGGLDPYDMRRKQRDFSLSGGYRKLIANIGAVFDVSVHAYSRDEEQFVETDLERVDQVVRNGGAAGSSRQAQEGNETRKEADVQMADESAEKTSGGAESSQVEELKDRVAAVIKFQLGASQYATMALRELSRGGVVAYKPELGSGK